MVVYSALLNQGGSGVFLTKEEWVDLNRRYTEQLKFQVWWEGLNPSPPEELRSVALSAWMNSFLSPLTEFDEWWEEEWEEDKQIAKLSWDTQSCNCNF